ncbi:NUDIX hydrolase [uncultured Tessaracoccus sp.]|uniref:NUDIX hydrolase n=1 Tax=uncultured Tessaracoccus sp. TaxID=905023 RepID=UPI00262688DB|nr:NUDIX domain-containing protein [uncultured Tessaracoccus sp.]
MHHEPRDCTFDEDGRWFRLRACAVLIHDGAVLMMGNEQDPYHYSIGGGVRHGETVEDAVRRECLEETGLDLEIDRLVFIHDHHFSDATTPELAGRECHEVAFYFLMRYDGQEIRDDSLTTSGLPERCEWVPIAEFGASGRMYPEFFGTELAELPSAPKLIATRTPS